MIKIYGGKISRADIVKWYLEEIDVPYDFVELDMGSGEHKKPEYMAINVFGKVPSIVEDDFQLSESGAILLYLAEKYGKLPESLREKAVITQWVLFGNSTLTSGIFVDANRETEMPRLLASLNEVLTDKSYIMGDEFSVADAAIAAYLAFIPMALSDFDLSPYPAVQAYFKRIGDRPAFQKCIGKLPD